MLDLASAWTTTGPKSHGQGGLRACGPPSRVAAEVLAEGRGEKVSDSVPALGPNQPLKGIGASRAWKLRTGWVKAGPSKPKAE